jgi:hypothetical protein
MPALPAVVITTQPTSGEPAAASRFTWRGLPLTAWTPSLHEVVVAASGEFMRIQRLNLLGLRYVGAVINCPLRNHHLRIHHKTILAHTARFGNKKGDRSRLDFKSLAISLITALYALV